MKIQIFKVFALVFLSCIVLLSACSGDSGSENTTVPDTSDQDTTTGPGANEEQVEIVFQSWITPNLTAEFYDEAIRKFEEVNPHIKVTRIQPPGNEGNADNYLKTLLASGDFPDVVQNITVPDFVKADALAEFPLDDETRQIRNVEDAFIDGKLYNIGPYGQPQNLIFYNKNLFEQAGINETPKTWQELLDVSETLKQHNITPMLIAGEWVSGFTFDVLTQTEIFGKNPVWYTDRWEDKVSFTDPEWVEAAEFFRQFVENGYFNEGALSIDYTQVEQEFLQGNGAMYPMGMWFTAAEAAVEKDFEVGVFLVPAKDTQQVILGGFNSGGFSVSKDSKHLDAAIEFVKFMNFDSEMHKAFAEADGLLSNLETPIHYDMTPLQQEVAYLYNNADVVTGFQNIKVGSDPVPGIFDQYTNVAQSLMFPETTDVVEQLQTLDEYWERTSQ